MDPEPWSADDAAEVNPLGRLDTPVEVRRLGAVEPAVAGPETGTGIPHVRGAGVSIGLDEGTGTRPADVCPCNRRLCGSLSRWIVRVREGLEGLN